MIDFDKTEFEFDVPDAKPEKEAMWNAIAALLEGGFGVEEYYLAKEDGETYRIGISAKKSPDVEQPFSAVEDFEGESDYGGTEEG